MSIPQISHRSSAGSGLGISNASLSPPTVSTTQVSTGFVATPPTSPERTSSPAARQYRFPESNDQSPSKPSSSAGQNRYQPKIALRPTHHRAISARNFASFSALPPTPTRNTPLGARDDERREGSVRSRRDDEIDGVGLKRNQSNTSNSSVGSRIKKSRSSEILRRLSTRGQETVSGGKYIPLSGVDDDAPPQQQPESSRQSRDRSGTTSTISAHPTQTPQSYIPSPETESTQHAISLDSHLPPLSPIFTRPQSQPQPQYYPDHENNQYPADPKRISDPSTGVHSKNHALLAAAGGGKMLAYSAADGIWSANSIASTPPTNSIAHHPQNLTHDEEEILKMRPWSYSTETHQRPQHLRSLSEGADLARYGTLLHPGSGGQRASTELGIMLGNKSRRLSQGKLLPAPDLDAWKAMGGEVTEKVKLEAAKKRRARVEIDVVLERECVVEGGEVRGRMEVRVNGSKSEGLRVGGGKVRVVGYEDISPQSRHIFYHHPFALPLFAHPPIPNGPRSSLFGSAPDVDGFREVVPGNHYVPFSMRLPLSGGAKGSYTSPHPKGPSVRYVVVGSVKLLHPRTGKRSIAHFYRPIVILPYLNPGIVLAPCEEMVEVVERRGLGWSLGGAKGVVELRIALGRDVWVSGQRVWCEIGIRNESSKRIKSLTLALLQTVHTFLPDDDRRAVSTDKDGFPNADEALGIASTTRRKVAEESIMADDQEYGGGRVTGKSWWTGVDAGDMGGWDLSLLIPNGLLTIPRSRLVEITYTLRLTANSSSNLFVDVPITLINFLSIDPPPMPGDGARFGQSNRSSQMISGQQYPHSHPVASTAGGHEHYTQSQGGSIRSGDSTEIGGAARASSTTLHIDALLSAGRARAEAEANANYPYPTSRQQRPISTYSEYGNQDIYGQHNIPLGGWANRSPLPFPPTSAGRPRVGRGVSYLSNRSGGQPISEAEEEDEEDEEEEDEAARLLLAAARREGRKMSLAALTRAAQREEEEYLQDGGLLSPLRESPPTGQWYPAETPYEEAFKVLGETPSMRRGSDADGLPVPTISSKGKGRRGSKAEEIEEMRRLERLTIAEEQEALASTRGSSDENHQYSSGEEGRNGYSDQDLRPADDDNHHRRLASPEDKRENRRSHEMIPEEEEPDDEGDDEGMLVGNETILEDLVGGREDDTLRMTLPTHQQESEENMFEYNDEIGRSPNPASGIDNAILGSLGSTSGTGHTSSSLRVPSRSGSALETMIIKSVDSEREAYLQHRSRSDYGSFAVSEQESEVGQVTEAVKRNLSIKTPSKVMKYRNRPDDGGNEGDEEMDQSSPTRAPIPRSVSSSFGLVPRKHSQTPPHESRSGTDLGGVSPKTNRGPLPNLSGGRRNSTSQPSASSPLRDKTLAPPSIGRGGVFANRPSFSFNASAPIRDGEREMSLSPRGGNTYSLSPGPSPRSGFPSQLSAEPMLRQLSSHSSHLRNQIRVRPPSEEVPPLAPSVASDSASSEGHGLDSPPIVDNPTVTTNVRDSLQMAGMEKPLPTDPIEGKPQSNLDPNWRPGPHVLHTQVAYARTSFSSPIGQLPGTSLTQNRSRKGSRAAEMSPSDLSHDDHQLVAPKSRPSSPSATSHSSHEPMISGMQNRLKQLEARDEALRKFSVASAVSGGGGVGLERERVGSGPLPRSSFGGVVGGYERERVGSGPIPRTSFGGIGVNERERIPSLPTIPRSSSGDINPINTYLPDRSSAPLTDETEGEKKVRKRRSYTTALGSRPIRSTSDDILDKPTNNLGGTTYIVRRPHGVSPPAIGGDPSTGFGWQSPPRLEVSYSPPSLPQPLPFIQPSLSLRRNMSNSSASTTATTIEAALAASSRTRSGPLGPRSSPAPRVVRQIPTAPEVDPYQTSAGGYAFDIQAYTTQSPEQDGFGRHLAPGQAYGAEAYGSEQGSMNSRAVHGLDRWDEGEREHSVPWMREGRGSMSQGTDESEGLL